MTAIRVTANGPTHLTGSALLPVPARPAAAFQSWGRITAYSPRNPIPAPRPAGVPQDKSSMARMGGDSRSSDSPNYWAPVIYFMRELAAPPNVSVYSDNQMPVPAVDPRGLPSVSMGRPRLGGQFQVGMPAAVQVFRNLNGPR